MNHYILKPWSGLGGLSQCKTPYTTGDKHGNFITKNASQLQSNVHIVRCQTLPKPMTQEAVCASEDVCEWHEKKTK